MKVVRVARDRHRAIESADGDIQFGPLLRILPPVPSVGLAVAPARAKRTSGATARIIEDSILISELIPDQAFVHDAFGSGRIEREEDAVREALALWEERERKRAEFRAALDDAMECCYLVRRAVKANGQRPTLRMLF